MRYQIADGSVSAGGETILSHIDFEIRGSEKAAVVGKNGAGKTTLLRLIAGELELDRDDRRSGSGILVSRPVTVGMLRQQAFAGVDRTVEEEILSACPFGDLYSRERFAYEQEYDRLFTGFGFHKADKEKKLASFSGGEQTKIALIRLLLEKPDILLLDEPTNHLDIQTTEWLEHYMKTYPQAVVMVSHDRFFLDRTADVVWELSDGKLTKYPGSYTHYREEKVKRIRSQRKAYERQQQELDRLGGLVDRFRHKPSKAAFARSKKKQMERLGRLDRPVGDDVHIFTGEISPLIPGSKWVFEAEHLKPGYDRPLLEISMRIRRGEKIGLLGQNGSGKTAFLKTAAGLIPGLAGKYRLGANITIGYFDQLSAQIESDKSVLEHFHDLFPSLAEKEARGILGGYLFSGRDTGKKVSSLSGGEKARLVLAELLQSRPNFLILDEPTNHMDIQAKETLESAFRAYSGTILFVSHDRYFVSRVAKSILIFENQSAMYYPFGYEHYLERKERRTDTDIAGAVRAEDQALIAGMRAVPKGERRCRETLEEGYSEWKLRLAAEKLEPAGERYGRLVMQREQALREWMESPEYWDETETDPRGGKPLFTQLDLQCAEAWQSWHSCCMEWLEALEESPGW